MKVDEFTAFKLAPKEKLLWKPISFQSAKLKYKFILYSKRIGATAKYIISQKRLNYPWTEISQLGPPPNTSIEEVKTKEFNAIRLCKFGIMEEGAKIVIPKEIDR